MRGPERYRARVTMPVARVLWRHYEVLHDVVYSTPEVAAAAEDAGYRGFWRGYFAMRAAPLGAVGPAPVTAAFHGFAPTMARRALPSVWSSAPPQAALDARRSGAAAALRRSGVVAASGAGLTGVERAAALAWTAASSADVEGRVLAAANAALPRPRDPLEALWQATTTLREHRGDGHVAVLVARGIGPVAAHLLKIGAGETDPHWLRTARGWNDEVWAATRDELLTRGWLDDSGFLTAAGLAEHDEIERLTDSLAARPWAMLGEERTAELVDLLAPMSAAVLAAGDIPERNPVGLVVDPDGGLAGA